MSHSTHNKGHFKDEYFQAISCTGTDNQKDEKKNSEKLSIISLSTYNKHRQNLTGTKLAYLHRCSHVMSSQEMDRAYSTLFLVLARDS